MKSHSDSLTEVRELHDQLYEKLYEKYVDFMYNSMYQIDQSNKDADPPDDEYFFFNNIIFDESLNLEKRNGHKNKDGEEAKIKICAHNWKKYTGFTDVYFFCENCDEKTRDEVVPPWWNK